MFVARQIIPVTTRVRELDLVMYDFSEDIAVQEQRIVCLVPTLALAPGSTCLRVGGNSLFDSDSARTAT